MIEVSSLSYAYDVNTALVFPDFKLAKGEKCLLLGESGSGKTTLLHLLGGLLKSQRGKITINNNDITQLSASALDQFRGRNIGLIFQRNHLVRALTVKRNLQLAPYLAGLKQDESRIDAVLLQLNLFEKRDANVSALSQGQAQRVAIARAVLNRPSVIIADEPTSALDDKNCYRVMDLLIEVAAENNATLIIATHDQRLKANITNQIQLKGIPDFI
jgi:ABC-type lipoprotein export system ATPase subunit